MPISPPTRRDARVNLERILTSARVVFAEHGFEAKLADVAKHAGVGVGTVYRRFGSKEELVHALFQSRVDEVSTVAAQAEQVPDPWDGLVYFLEHTCRMMSSDQGLRDLMMNGRVPRTDLAAPRENFSRSLAALIERARRNGSLRDDIEPTDIPAIMFMLQATNDFAAAQSPDLWHRMLTIVLDGLRADGTQRSTLPVAAMSQAQLDAALQARRCPTS
ncbi:MAG: TetR/AcrR family transcriptional regulator [Rhodococcus sp.]|nr:TetR/AcrR family transcriptional regulator [Rhodococcus sp. (in: high G+C Gram-positive bacteria)]